jgi:GNAT superfamily N-acetyltransferase
MFNFCRVAMMEVKLVYSKEEIKKAALVFLELRPSFTLDSITKQIKAQIKEGYQIAVVEEDDEYLCAAGFVIVKKLAWGKHIYIDDLVTKSNKRSIGAGKLIIDWFKKFAIENDCKEIHLDSGVQRFDAHKFYLREGFIISSHHFTLKL